MIFQSICQVLIEIFYFVCFECDNGNSLTKKRKSYIEIFKNFLYRKPATSSEAILADSKRSMVISSTFPNNGIAPYQTIVLFTKRIGVTIFD